MIRTALVPFLLMLTPAFACAAERAADDSQPGLDLAVRVQGQLTRVQFHVRSGQGNYHALWQARFHKLLQFCDSNGDAELNQQEAQRLPSALALRELASSGFAPVIGRPPQWSMLDADQNEEVTVEELSAYYRHEGLGTIAVGIGVAPFTTPLTTALLQQLDRNGDSTISLAELNEAEALLRKLDQNDDELVGASELVTDIYYPGTAGNILLHASSRQPVTLPDSLAHFPLMLVPRQAKQGATEQAVELSLQLSVVESEADSTQTRLSIESSSAKQQPAGIHRWESADTWITIRADQGKLADYRTEFRDNYIDQFEEADADQNELLSHEEWSAPEQGFGNGMATILDHDHNRSISRAELDAWLQLQGSLAEGQLFVTALDCGCGLFELLDADRNGGLSLRELRDTSRRMQSAGCIESGSFQREKLPRQLLLTVSQGRPTSALGSYRHDGSDWFLAMDRNADGDVSPREFVGPRTAFQRLDANHDHLLSNAESQAGE